MPRRRHISEAPLIAALAIGICASGSAHADPVCNPGVKWAYTGTARGTASIRETAKATVLEFTPAGGAGSVVFSSTNESAAGVYQVTADLEVAHLSDEATVGLEGASSAAVGRPFEVTLAAGDGGSSGFSRPIATTGAPFTIAIATKASRKISFAVRNFVVCKLR